MRKELPNQESLFDSIPASDRLYGVGDRLYRLVLDSVRPIVVTEAFECVFVNKEIDISLCRFSTLRWQAPTHLPS